MSTAELIERRMREGECWNCGKPKEQCTGWWDTVHQKHNSCPSKPPPSFGVRR